MSARCSTISNIQQQLWVQSAEAPNKRGNAIRHSQNLHKSQGLSPTIWWWCDGSKSTTMIQLINSLFFRLPERSARFYHFFALGCFLFAKRITCKEERISVKMTIETHNLAVFWWNSENYASKCSIINSGATSWNWTLINNCVCWLIHNLTFFLEVILWLFFSSFRAV
jgi:hypothetical protein